MDDCLQAYDWIRLAEQAREQLDAAASKLADRGTEQRWLGEARELLSQNGERRAELLQRARRLPELTAIRQEHASDLIGPWVDAVEHLYAGIVFNAGLRSPLLEALFPHKKFEVLRRVNFDVAQEYGADFQRRLSSSYIDRLLARDEFAFAQPALEQVKARFAPLATNGEATLSKEERAELIEQLTAEAQSIELAIKQARLLAEAALLPIEGAFQELGIRNKPKPRSVPKKKAAPIVEDAAEQAPTPPKEPKKIKAPTKEKAPAKAKPEAKAKSAKKRKGQAEASA